MNEIPQSVAPGFFPNNPDGTGLVFSYHFDADGRRTADPQQARWTWRSYLATDIRARVTIDREPLLPPSVREFAAGARLRLPHRSRRWLAVWRPARPSPRLFDGGQGPRPFPLRAQRDDPDRRPQAAAAVGRQRPAHGRGRHAAIPFAGRAARSADRPVARRPVGRPSAGSARNSTASRSGSCATPGTASARR